MGHHEHKGSFEEEFEALAYETIELQRRDPNIISRVVAAVRDAIRSLVDPGKDGPDVTDPRDRADRPDRAGRPDRPETPLLRERLHVATATISISTLSAAINKVRVRRLAREFWSRKPNAYGLPDRKDGFERRQD